MRYIQTKLRLKKKKKFKKQINISSTKYTKSQNISASKNSSKEGKARTPPNITKFGRNGTQSRRFEKVTAEIEKSFCNADSFEGFGRRNGKGGRIPIRDWNLEHEKMN